MMDGKTVSNMKSVKSKYINKFEKLLHLVGLLKKMFKYSLCFGPNSPQWARASSFTSLLDHTHKNTR
jgi:hypothetical protein